jgi:ABC-type sugar transport system, ATPase component
MSNDVLIRLENITKQYGGTEEPAVNNLTMDVLRGEVLVLVGLSSVGSRPPCGLLTA